MSSLWYSRNLFLFTANVKKYSVLRVTKMSSDAAKMLSVDFEVFGRVQGVFFRKYTLKEAQQLGLNGYCMNTMQGTVVGTIQGDTPKVLQMKQWLEKTGSPDSKIEKAEFKNEKEIKNTTYKDFSIKR